jgi:glutamate racemase
MPRENFIYFADLARVPYGEKSSSMIRNYKEKIVDFMVSQNVKALVVACNTMCAVSDSDLRGRTKIPMFEVLKAGVSATVDLSPESKIGVIATAATVREMAYESAILKKKPTATVTSVECPLLVPLIEEGWYERRVTREILSEYLEEFKFDSLDAIILGCTHYSFIRSMIRSLIDPRTVIIDPGSLVAEELQESIQNGRILENELLKRASNIKFFVTGNSERFSRVVRGLIPGFDDASLHTICLD